MDAVVFSWSGSFTDDARAEEIAGFAAAARDRGMEIGLVASEPEEDLPDLPLDPDFVLGPVEDLSDVLRGLRGRYDTVFFVSDVPAELATANRSGAFTAGFTAGAADADALSGVGPNYLVDALDELLKILDLEALD